MLYEACELGEQLGLNEWAAILESRGLSDHLGTKQTGNHTQTWSSCQVTLNLEQAGRQ